MKPTCLISGAGGFVGASVARRFISEGFDVSVLLRSHKHYWRLAGLEGEFTSVIGDLAEASAVDIIGRVKPEYIFHFATYGAYPKEADYERMVHVNMKGIYHIIEGAKRSGTKLVINTGSSSEYGIKDHPMKESDIPEPINDYGVTKTAATLYCQKEARQHNVPVVTFRLFSVYGPYEEKGRLVPTVILNALSGTPIPLSSPESMRDYVYLEDVADAYAQATRVTHVPGSIYNIGTGREYSVNDVAETVINLTGSRSPLEWGKIEKQVRQMEPSHWVADSFKAERFFGWKARHTLSEGLKTTIEWYKTHKHLYE